MLIFGLRIKGILRIQVMDNGDICRQTSVLQFSWNGTMLWTEVTIAVTYVVIFALRNFVANSSYITLFATVLRYSITLYVNTRLHMFWHILTIFLINAYFVHEGCLLGN